MRERLGKLTEKLREIKDNPAMLKEIIHQLWLTFKQPLAVIILAGIGLLILIPPLTYLYFVHDLGSKESIMAHKNSGVILKDRNGKTFFTFYQAKTKKIVPLDSIPQYAQQAVVAVEDKNFYEEPGFSIRGIGRALVSDLKKQELAQGGSTITQQLVKNTLLSPEKSFLRKYQEIFLALELERRYSKDDILEMYLNTVYFGEGAFGIEDAAHTYFNKDANNLTLGESALLAGILPAPSAYSPLTGNRDEAFRRQKIVLSQMQQQGYITKDQMLEAQNQQITFNPQKEDLNVIAPHFALMVKDELIKQYGEQEVANSGFTVTTTLDLSDQEYAEQVVKTQVARLARNNASNGAAVAMDPKTGEILALVGSHDWSDPENGKVNMVTTPRQPGSSFKPIVYAKAFDEHLITPATQLDDKPVTFPGGYSPHDYDRQYRGEVSARIALANSLNIPAVHVMDKVGVQGAIDEAENLGITTLDTPDRYGLSLVLGAAEVPLLQMTGAYATFADQGTYVTPTTIMQIQDKSGKVIFTHDPQTRDALDPGVAFQISSILSDNQARAMEFGNALTISRPAAVKTGTTEDYKDALTLGYTPSLVVGVWVGNNDNTPMDSVAGSLGAAPIWRQMMEHMLAGTPVEHFSTPSNILQVTICKENGLRAETATSSAYTEYFLPGTIPTESCTGPMPSITESPTPSPTAGDTPTPTPTAIQQTPTPTPTSSPTPTPGNQSNNFPTPTIQVHIP
jgi:1A family penicillin-binding protein